MLYLSYLAHRPCPPPTSDPKPRRPSTTFRPRLLCVGVPTSISPLFWRGETPRPTLLLRITVSSPPYFFFLLVVVLVFIFPFHQSCSGLAWRLNANPTPQLLLSPTGCNHFPVTPYTHEGLYILTNLPGRDLSQPPCAGCVSWGVVQRPYVQPHYMIYLFRCHVRASDRDLLLLVPFLLSFVRACVCACACVCRGV